MRRKMTIGETQEYLEQMLAYRLSGIDHDRDSIERVIREVLTEFGGGAISGYEVKVHVEEDGTCNIECELNLLYEVME